MDTVNFNNSHKYFCDSDRLIFKNIVGMPLERLESEIANLPPEVIKKVYGNDKFILSQELNEMGLHIYRIMLSRKIYEKRMSLADNSYVKFFHENGYLVISDFLSEETIEFLSEDVDRMRKFSIGKRHIDFPQLQSMNPKLLDFIKMCVNVPYLSLDAPDGHPRTEIWHHRHHEKDPQYKFHTDTFQPTFKFWVYIEDITVDQGPLNIISNSHIPTESRLAWDYENSIISPSDNLWNHRVQSNGQPGSFRIYENGSIENEEDELKRLGYNDIIEFDGKKNTLVAANTYAFHRRGLGLPNTERNSLSIQYRPLAFGDYK